MDKRSQVSDLIVTQGVLPLYFHPSPEVSIAILKALYAAGVRAIEYTNRGEEALKNFKILRSLCDSGMEDMVLGAGTVKDGATADRFINAGAEFLVSPGFTEDVFDAAYANKILWIPGCMTPTEIIHAEKFGIMLIKLFPGNILGPAYLHAIKDIFTDLRFMPTGGVDPEKENLQNWFRAGVCAVGMGSKLITPLLLRCQDYEGITRQAAAVMQMIDEIRAAL